MIDETLKAFTEDMAVPDRAIHSDELPWVPQGERVWFKPLRFDLVSGAGSTCSRLRGAAK